jgi:excisionase family DNA binding protein
MLTKKEAAEYLGVSTRTLERYVKTGKLSVRYEDSPNGEIALFDSDELDQFSDDKQTPRIKPASMDSDLAMTTSDMVPSRGVGGLLAPFQELTERLILALSERNEASNQMTPAMLQGKLLFTLAEAQIMTGLSREILIEAIKDGRLPSQIMGKGYRIKTKDLESFVDNLW